jgi:heme A synthase
MQKHTLFRVLAVAGFVATYVTILLGGNVMASGAGLSCPDWPTCHGTIIPAGLTSAQAIELSHRVAAFVTGVVVAAMALVGLYSERSRPALRGLSVCAAVLVLAQAMLGGLVIDTSLAVGVVLLHFALATVLFGLLLLIAFLANRREIPRRWADWAVRASEDEPASATLARMERHGSTESPAAPSGSHRSDAP